MVARTPITNGHTIPCDKFQFDATPAISAIFEFISRSDQNLNYVPPEGILFILPVNNILDMFRTAVNVTGDMVCSIYIDTVDKKAKA